MSWGFNVYGLILFFVGSLGALYLTRMSARAGFRHGLARFFAFEAILGLTALNLHFWFDDPFSASQLISWGLLVLSALLALHSFRLLGRSGEAQGEFEQTTVLVTSGAYNYIRHPMYASLLYFSLGVFLKQVSLLTFGLVLAAFACLYITARVEEGENLERFGKSYRMYMLDTKMFVPYLF
jgi:protein-S-isoprenylcysteine O-methyltransferase Ste14